MKMKKTILMMIITGIFLACELMSQVPGETLWTRQTTNNGFITNKVPAPIFELSPTVNINNATTPNRDMWDVLYTFETSCPSMPGIETDGVNIYTASFMDDLGTFSRYEMDGTLLGDFTIPGISHIRDMAYDGTYFYGSPATMTIYIMDLANETLIGTIPVTCDGLSGVRHIAFDPDLDGGNGGFWVGNWFELGAITMSGAQIYASMTNPGDIYGSAYDEWTAGGPYIWLFSQNGSGAVLHQFDIAALATTGVTHDASDIPGFSAGVAGGLATFVNDDGVFIMLANLQQHPNLVGAYEIAIASDPSAPGASTDVTVTPDAGGAQEAEIGWTCPTLDVEGNILTDLDEMRIYRDGTLVYTDTSPTIGAAGSYTDTVSASATYIYGVVGYNDFGEGIPVYVSDWVGEDVPNIVTDILLEQTNPEELSGTLTWINPTTGLNGGAFNEAILGYHIERNDGVIFEVAGETTEYIDNTIPVSENYFYTIQAYNSVGDGGIETSNVVLIADAGLLLMEGFYDEIIPADWNIVGEGQNNWLIINTNNAGGIVPELMFNWAPSFAGVSRMVTQPLNTSGMTELVLEFKHFLNDYNGNEYSIGFQSTSDGTTWNDIVIYNPTGDIGPETVTETFTNADVGSATFQLALYFNGTSFNLDNWFVDDIKLTGDATQTLGFIEGTVTLNSGTGNVEDVEVTAGNVAVNPNINGDYTIEIEIGTYDVTATLEGYDPDTINGVIVEEGVITPGINLTLVYNSSLNSPQNLFVDELGYATWDTPGGETDVITHHTGYEGNGIGNGGVASWSCAARFDAVELVDFYGSVLTDVNVHIRTADFSYVEVNVWEGGSFGDPGTLVYAEDITTSVLIEDWTNHVLTTPIPLIAGNEYWIGYSIDATGDYPASVDAGPVVPDKGDWMLYEGDWLELTSWGLDYNWCIEGVVGASDDILTKNTMKTNPIIKTHQIRNTIFQGKIKAAFNHPIRKADTSIADNKDLIGYNIYLNGVYVEFTTNLFYQFNGLVNGTTYLTEVTAVYDEGESDPVEYTFVYNPSLNPPQNLFVDELGYTTWDTPGGETDVITHHTGYEGNGIGNGGVASWSCAARFDAVELVDFYGSVLTDVNVHIRTADFSYVEVNVWEGGSFGDPGTLVYAEDITTSVLIEDWTNHVLTTPIPLIAGNEYWIGYSIDATGGYPSSVDAGPVVPDKGDWIFYDGEWLELISWGLDYNWCIEGVVGESDDILTKNTIKTNLKIKTHQNRNTIFQGKMEAAFNHPIRMATTNYNTRNLIGYNVYLDGGYVEYSTDLFYQYIGLINEQTYVAGVSAVYDEGESEIIEFEFTYILPVLNPPQNLFVTEKGYANWDAPSSEDLLGYNVYLDGDFVEYTTDLFYQYIGLINEQTHIAGVSAVYDEGESEIIEYEFTCIFVGVDERLNNPNFSLSQNYPNPFSNKTTIYITTTVASDKNTMITVYNFTGQKIKTLVDKKLGQGTHQIVWDGTDYSGNQVLSGIYFYKMECGDKYIFLKKMILMK